MTLDVIKENPGELLKNTIIHYRPDSGLKIKSNVHLYFHTSL